MKKGYFYSRGKFLLSGEYLVLDGALALAVPLKPGQSLQVTEIPEPGILRWETHICGNEWFKATYKNNMQEILNSNNRETAIFIQKLLDAALNLKHKALPSETGYLIHTEIEFDINWGLGSSSSLISNLAYWLDLDPYALYKKVFNGSGYDVFCARASKPILYQLENGVPMVREIDFNPSFLHNLSFIYLGKKQDSQESVRNFRELAVPDNQIIGDITALTNGLVHANSLIQFMELLENHEQILSRMLGRKTVKEELFPGFNGAIKSLGAWGGDFIMAASPMDHEDVKEYFRKKAYPVIFRWDEIVY